jgi:hypothetical protein
MTRPAWFYRYTGWNGANYYWPCHWVGALLMVAANGFAFISAGVIVGVLRAVDFPMLGWLSVIAIVAVYGGFGRIAGGHARV